MMVPRCGLMWRSRGLPTIFTAMKQILLLFIWVLLECVPISSFSQPFETRYERSGGTETATYAEVIAFYKTLATRYSSVTIDSVGETDAGYPLHVVYYNYKPGSKQVTLLINNGIHPGEPDGIDACMLLLRNAAMGKIEIPENVALAVIPVFNIGGMLNRGCCSRVNQNGPKEYGFRGNSQNLDLNRDFVKLDARETQSLIRLFHKLDPDVFIDNHVSDGADYQHVVTLLSTQHDKLGGEVGKYMHNTLEPLIYKDMKQKGYDLVPYVNDFDKTPDQGWVEFYEPARFSSGFAALFQTFAFVPETHMLKPYWERVQSTYALLRTFISITSAHIDDIKEARRADRKQLMAATTYHLHWVADTTRFDKVTFKGYAAGYKPSEVSGLPRLYYDHTKPYVKQVNFYNHFVSTDTITYAAAYVVPGQWHDVIIRLKWNGVAMQHLDKDTVMEVNVCHIDNYETVPRPYEKHYLHKNVKVHWIRQSIPVVKGDYIVAIRQPAKRYITEVLEPTGTDAFLAWGFFDGILQQKEYYSDYVFEDDAARILKKNSSLKQRLNEKKKTDAVFAKSASQQLDFIYNNSPYHEPEYMQYPVYRIEQ